MVRLKPIRVLWLLKELGVGGTERLLLDLAPPLVDRVVFWPVAVADRPRDFEGAYRAAGLEPRYLGATGNLDPRWVMRLRRLVRQTKPDIVHLHNPLPGAGGRLALLGSGIPSVYTEHSLWSFYRLPSRIANALTYRMNDAVIGVSSSVASAVGSSLWGRRGPVLSVIPNGVDAAAVRQDAAKQRSTAPALRRPSYGVVGHLRSRKGIDVFLRAAARIESEMPKASGYVVGRGEDEVEMRHLHRSLGLSACEFLGFRPDARAVMASLDVFVVPSRVEGLPLALLEAMALGCAIVATKVGGVPEVLTDDVDGILVPAEDPGALAAAIIRLLQDPHTARRLGSAAMETVEDRFDAHRMAEQHLALYERLLERPR